jgi:hypothetical protein
MDKQEEGKKKERTSVRMCSGAIPQDVFHHHLWECGVMLQMGEVLASSMLTEVSNTWSNDGENKSDRNNCFK